MALQPCKECGKEISDKAEACPNCGFKALAAVQKQPAAKAAAEGPNGCLTMITLAVVIWLIYVVIGPSTSDKPAGPSSDETAATPACKASLDCLRSNLKSAVAYDCQRAIESQAKWDFEWTDGLGEPKFPNFVWANQERTAVTLSGNKLKMQNGFGAWKHVIYLCEVDINTRAVRSVNIVE